MSDLPSSETDDSKTTHDLLVRSATAATELQRDDGSFPPGKNGVYDEPQTPVRTTSNWLRALAEAHTIDKDSRFAAAADRAADYLLSDIARPYGYTFHSRNAAEKDHCDGLIGQAAPIAALATAGRIFDRPELVDTASDVFSLHPFNPNLGLWERVEISGDRLSFDRTLNHQLAFAAAGATLSATDTSIDDQITRFLDRLRFNIEMRTDGLIRHLVRPPIGSVASAVASDRRHWRLLVNQFVSYAHSYSTSRRQQEIGYHPFCLKFLGLLKRAYPEHPVWNKEFAQRVVEFSKRTDLRGIPFGSMLPGIDTAIGHYYIADDSIAELTSLILKDIREKFDPNSGLFTENAIDPEYQSSLVVTLANLPDILLEDR